MVVTKKLAWHVQSKKPQLYHKTKSITPILLLYTPMVLIYTIVTWV